MGVAAATVPPAAPWRSEEEQREAANLADKTLLEVASKREELRIAEREKQRRVEEQRRRALDAALMERQEALKEEALRRRREATATSAASKNVAPAAKEGHVAAKDPWSVSAEENPIGDAKQERTAAQKAATAQARVKVDAWRVKQENTYYSIDE